MKPRLYSRNMELLSVLRYAHKIGYTHRFNDMWSASFYLPVDDDTNDLCEAQTIIDIFDGDKSVGKYRILEEPEADITAEDGFIEYSCEHVIAFLLNDAIEEYLELGGEGFTTRQVIEVLLSYQVTKRWKLGRCDFDYEFQYSWENTNVLDALFSIPKCFADKYHWEYDTSSYPWTINLVKLPSTPTCEIRRKRNCQYIKRAKDNSSLATRLYCKGSGEGVNQLTIAEVNPTGKKYIDSDTIGIYGIMSSHYIDLTCNDASTLLAKGKQILEEVKHPRYTYSTKAVHLARMTGNDWYHYEEGRCVRMLDGKKIDITTTIIEVSKADIEGNPLDIDIVLSNKSADVASAIDDLTRRAAITAQYSQGATNLYSQQFADNADEDHPAVMKFFIPKDCAKINGILLSWSLEKFRAYSRGASASSKEAVTSEQGGSTTATTEKLSINYEGLGKTDGPYAGYGEGSQTSSPVISTVTDEATVVIDEAGAHKHTGPNHRHSFSGSDSLAWGHQHSYGSIGDEGNTGGVVGYSALEASIEGNTGYAGTGDTGEAGSHTHTTQSHWHPVGEHRHNMYHQHNITSINIPALQVEIPAHSHTVNVPGHSHGISYGIYEGGKAEKVTVKVDGTEIPAGDLESDEMDIVKYLAKDSNGKITRGTWHEIEIAPDAISRIEANLFVQTFVTSHSGGSY